MNKVITIILIILISGLIIYSFLGNQEGFTDSTSTNTTSTTPNLNLVEDLNSESANLNTNSTNNLFPYTGVYNSNSYDNYNHYNGSQSPLIPGTYHEPTGGSVTISTNSDGSLTIKEKNSDKIDLNIYTSSIPNTNSSTISSPSVYYGVNGGSASIVKSGNGEQSIQVMQPNGSVVVYSPSSNLPQLNNPTNNISSSAYFGSTGNSIPSNYNLAYTPSNTTMNNYATNSNTMNSSSTSSGSGSYQQIFYGQTGAVAVVNNANNSAVIVKNGRISSYSNPNPGSGNSTTLKNPYGGTLTVSLVNNQFNITVVDESGNTETFTMNPTQNNLIFNINQYNGSTLNSPNGSSASINSNTVNIVNNDGTTTVYKSYNSPNVFVNPNGGTVVISPTSNNSFLLVVVDNQGNTQIFNPTSSNNQTNNNSNNTNANSFTNIPFLNNIFSNNTNANNPYYSGQGQSQNNQMNNYNPYSSALPSGIPASQIPGGKEDLYILKSEVIPPICPACPTVKACDKKEKCPPCPACARCPEPSFECKKVPNYNSSYYDSGYYGYNDGLGSNISSSSYGGQSLPIPVLNDFSTFGT